MSERHLNRIYRLSRCPTCHRRLKGADKGPKSPPCAWGLHVTISASVGVRTSKGEGKGEGKRVGFFVGFRFFFVGKGVGLRVMGVGKPVGRFEGKPVGNGVGRFEGKLVGNCVGNCVGKGVGFFVSLGPHAHLLEKSRTRYAQSC